jgi:hypothetical protein
MSVTLQLGVWLSVGDGTPVHIGTAEVETQTTQTADGIEINVAPWGEALAQAAEALRPDPLGPKPEGLDHAVQQFRASGGTPEQLTAFARIAAQGVATAADIDRLASAGIHLADPRG